MKIHNEGMKSNFYNRLWWGKFMQFTEFTVITDKFEPRKALIVLLCIISTRRKNYGTNNYNFVNNKNYISMIRD